MDQFTRQNYKEDTESASPAHKKDETRKKTQEHKQIQDTKITPSPAYKKDETITTKMCLNIRKTSKQKKNSAFSFI